MTDDNQYSQLPAAAMKGQSAETWLKQHDDLLHDLVCEALNDGACGRAYGSHPETDRAEKALQDHARARPLLAASEAGTIMDCWRVLDELGAAPELMEMHLPDAIRAALSHPAPAAQGYGHSEANLGHSGEPMDIAPAGQRDERAIEWLRRRMDWPMVSLPDFVAREIVAAFDSAVLARQPSNEDAGAVEAAFAAAVKACHDQFVEASTLPQDDESQGIRTGALWAACKCETAISLLMSTARAQRAAAHGGDHVSN
jgi:hypothetical protein